MEDITKYNIKFSGKSEDYSGWSERFLAYAGIKGVEDYYIGKTSSGNPIDVPDDNQDLDETDPAEKLLLIARKDNRSAYGYLRLCTTNITASQLINNAKTTKLPKGDAALAWKLLKDYYEPNSDAEKFSLENAFSNCVLLEGQNPDDWFSKLDAYVLRLKNDFGLKTYDDDRVRSHILYNTKPKIYKNLLENIKRELSHNKTVSLIQIRKDIRFVFDEHKNNNNEGQKEEIALVATPVQAAAQTTPAIPATWTQTRTPCDICGKIGHRAADCFSKPENAHKLAAFRARRGLNNNGTGTNGGGIICDFCKKPNHTEATCHIKQFIEANKFVQQSDNVCHPTTEQDAMVMVIMNAETIDNLDDKLTVSGYNKHTFIADSGASCHMRNSLVGMTNLKECNIPIRVGDNTVVYCKQEGEFQGTVIQKDGRTFPIKLERVLYVPELWVNLFSISMAIQKPHITLGSIGKYISLNFNNKTIIFEKESNISSVLAVDIIPMEEVATPMMEFELFHKILGHPNYEATKATADKMGIKLKGEKNECEICCISKIKKKKLNKISLNKATSKLFRIAIDITSVAYPSFGGAKYWLMIQDEYTGFIWSFFLKQKSDLAEVAYKWIVKIQIEMDTKINYIRCDNAGENKTLQEVLSLDPRTNIKFEYTAPYTPQQNGKIERKFATLWGKNRAILNEAKLSRYLRDKLWAQGAHMVTQLENIVVSKKDQESPYEKFYGNNPIWVKHMHMFGEIAIIKDERMIKSKLENRGFPAMFISYTDDHAGGVFKFLNLETERVLTSRNVVWLKQSYGEYKGIKGIQVPLSPEDLDYGEDEEEAKDVEPEPILVEEHKIVDVSEAPQALEDKQVDFNDAFAIGEIQEGNKIPNLERGIRIIREPYPNFQEEEDEDLIGMIVEATKDDKDEDEEPPDEGGENIIINNEDDLIDETIRFFTEFQPNMTSYDANYDLDQLTQPEQEEKQEQSTEQEDQSPIKEEEFSMVEMVERKIKKIEEKINRQLGTFYNADAGKRRSERKTPGRSVKQRRHTLNLVEELMLAIEDDGKDLPVTYHQAKVHKNYIEWWKAMCVEFNNMETKGVWKIQPKSELPPGRKVIGNRWVFAKKDDGRFRARTVAKGFSQIPGKDFEENHAPVVNDTTLHLIIAIKTLLKLHAGQFDIETAFLYGDLEEDLWMAFPDGYEDYLKMHGIEKQAKTHCLKLEKAIYGLVQAARQWWKKFTQIMAEMDFQPSMADPCLFVRKEKANQLPAFIILYVDDGGIFGTPEVIKNVLKEMSEKLKVKDLGKMESFVGFQLVEDKKEETVYLYQPKIIKRIEQKFGHLIKTDREYKTPGAPGIMVVRPNPDDPKLDADMQTQYRSGVGMLLYLIKHSRPELSNSVRELTKVMDGATEAHWKMLLRVIKYTLDTKHVCLKIKPRKDATKLFEIEGFSDSEFGGDKTTRKSVYGYVIYFCGAPIAWKSKASASVTLSATEAEYFASSEATKEVVFIKNLLDTMYFNCKLPITIRGDNAGAIYISNNYAVGNRTKHIDIRTHYVRNLIQDGMIRVTFVPTADNDADIFTKNTSEMLFEKHTTKMVYNIEQLLNHEFQVH